MKLRKTKNVAVFIQDTYRLNRKQKHITVYDTNTTKVYNIIYAALKKACKERK